MVEKYAYRFYRLVRKPQTGAGRRYYKLVSYPQDTAALPGDDDARCMAEVYRYAAIQTETNAWIILDDKAQQCIEWHAMGKEGYVYVF